MPETNDDLGLLIRATQFATQRHRDQKRKDEITPYITHPIALAATLSDAGVRDVNVLAAALLHDTIEDTDATYDDIRGEFGKQIADLVAEVTMTLNFSKRPRAKSSRCPGPDMPASELK